MTELISLIGLEKTDVLMALYNAAQPQGMGFLHYDPTPLTPDEAKELLAQGDYFDYLRGRIMKVDLGGDTLDPRLFDRDNGEGSAKAVIDSLRETGSSNNEEIQETHLKNTLLSALNTKTHLEDKTKTIIKGRVVEINLGLSDVKEHLQPKIDPFLENK